MQGGQGDAVMAANGLQALREIGAAPLADDAICYTRTYAEPLIRIMLPDIKVSSLSYSKHSSRPRYSTSSKTSWTTVFRNWFTNDCYVNFAERRRWASYGYPAPGLNKRLQQFLTDIKLASSNKWQRETPAYYGLKMWAPLAQASSLSEIDLLRGLYLSYQTISQRMKSYMSSLEKPISGDAAEIAFFPGGKSFQYLPPVFLKKLISELGLDNSQYVCCFSPEDQSIADYKSEGLNSKITTAMHDILSAVAHSKVTVTADSFVSHIAQLAADKHVAMMSHDLPQHTIHPAADSLIIYEPVNCCPCNYINRSANGKCPSGHHVCRVFLIDRYLEKSINALKKCILS